MSKNADCNFKYVIYFHKPTHTFLIKMKLEMTETTNSRVNMQLQS